MNIKDFLLDNYIYIIIVIVLIIITIIGFLADKKKNGDKKMAAAGNNNPGYDPNAGGQITYQPNAGMMPGQINTVPSDGTLSFQMNNNIMPQMNQPVENNNFGVTPQPMNNMGNFNMPNMSGPNVLNAPQPVEPINNVMSNPEPIYQPMAEQPNLQNNMAMPQNIVPSPFAEASPIINNQAMMPNQMNQSVNMSMVNQPQITPQMEQNNIMQPMNNTIGVQQPLPINNTMPQFTGNPTQPANPMPMPGPVDNTVPNPITPPQPVNPTPVGFVYGAPTNNNNNNM